MRFGWIIECEDVERVKAFFARHRDNAFVKSRIARNLAASKIPISKDKFWEIHIGCLITSQQRAGPDSAVARFMSPPFRLSYEACRSKHQDQLADFCVNALRDGHLRRYSVISREIVANLRYLEEGGWERTLDLLEVVRLQPTSQTERLAAEFLDDNLKGFGPKQSRNLLQWLGLSRFETPIDSRITRWLNDFGFPFELTAKALGDRTYYQLASDGFQKLAAACEVAPCVLDAAIFASYDGDGWTVANTVHIN